MVVYLAKVNYALVGSFECLIGVWSENGELSCENVSEEQLARILRVVTVDLFPV